MYKTLPSSLRRKTPSSSSSAVSNESDSLSISVTEEQRPSTPPAESSVFGGIHLNISNLFTGGMSTFLGQFRKQKTPSSPTSPGVASPHPSTLSSPPSNSSSSRIADHTHQVKRNSSFDEAESFELIEFPSSASEGSGAGHSFINASSSNPTWCDHCGQIIWGIYDNVGSKCSLCDFTCHTSCTSRVRLDCLAEEEDTLIDVSELTRDNEEDLQKDDEGTLKGPFARGTLSGDSSFEGPDEEDESDDTTMNEEVEGPSPICKSDSVYCLSQALSGSGDLASSLDIYNEIFPPGQKTLLEKDQKINGFIRVTMNLRRPINVIAGMRPPSIYRMDESMDKQRRTLSSFHLAPNTVKAIHVNSETSTRDVIRFLLAKFRIADNPHKYALYERYSFHSTSTTMTASTKRSSKTLSRIQMRRIAEDELPLLLALRWAVHDLLEVRSLVLQENDPGEICWEAFTSPELKNFLLILDREEAWYKKSIHEKYDHIRNYMEELLLKKREEGIN